MILENDSFDSALGMSALPPEGRSRKKTMWLQPKQQRLNISKALRWRKLENICQVPV